VHFHCSRDLSTFSSASAVGGGGRGGGMIGGQQVIGNSSSSSTTSGVGGLSRLLHVYDDSMAKKDDGLLSPLPEEAFSVAAPILQVGNTSNNDTGHHGMLLDVSQFVTVKGGGGGGGGGGRR